MKKKTCPECGSVNLPSETMCDQCGCALQDAQTAVDAPGNLCPNCSKPLEEGIKFCDGCGADLSQSVETAQQEAPEPLPDVVSPEVEAIPEAKPTVDTPEPEPSVPKQKQAEPVAEKAVPETKVQDSIPPAEMAPQTTRSMAETWKLSTVEGFHLGKEYLLFKDEMLLGRQDPEEDIYPDIDLEDQDDGYISRKHALLRRNGSGFTVEDLGGENGTLVNQRPIPPFKPSQLAEGQVVRIGKVGLMLKMHQTPG